MLNFTARICQTPCIAF